MMLCVTSRPDAERPERRYHAGVGTISIPELSLLVPIAPRGHAARDALRHIPESASLFLNDA